MRKAFRILSIILVVASMLAVFSACSESEKTDVWENATYTQNKEFGNGAKKLEVEVRAEDKSVLFTIYSDKKTVGEALIEHDLISGEQGAYGMYVKVVNGITADYDINQSYWSFNKNGGYQATGVDQTEFSDGDRFELVYTAE